MHFVDIGKRPPVFEDAAKVAQEILKSPYEFDFGQMYYNVFKSAVGFYFFYFLTVSFLLENISA